MVQAAQGDEVRELGLPAVGPVLDVVRVDIALVRATGEAAAAIAGVERAADRRGDAAGFAPDIERLAALGLEHLQQAGIAGEAAHGLGGEGGSLLDLAAPGGVLTLIRMFVREAYWLYLYWLYIQLLYFAYPNRVVSGAGAHD